MWGVDPDLWTLGWARVEASFTRPSTAPATIEQVWLGVWSPEGKGVGDIEQANAMIGSLANPKAPWARDEAPRNRDHVAAEAQRIYPNRNAKPTEVVAKANDLLRLAQISGAFQGMFAADGYARTRSFKPDYWKHNAKKEAMHAVAIKRVDERPDPGKAPIHLWTGTDVTVATSLQTIYKGMTKAAGRLDAFDAVCLALFAVDEIMYGRWAV
jgi:hypothetical protein